MHITEQLLWKYIDHDCSPEEKKQVEQALKSDEFTRQEFKRLLAFHNSFLNLFARMNKRGECIDTPKMQGKIYEDPQQFKQRSEN